jgi:tRNA(Ile)-lysidine synthase
LARFVRQFVRFCANSAMSHAPLPDRVAAAWPPEGWRDVTALVATSGGADSVALVRALCEIRQPGEGRLVLAHFNHRLRGAESDADQSFVEQLSVELGLEVVSDHAGSNWARWLRGKASEEDARHGRYRFLQQAADRCGARYVATAHTADDQVETILHNILRGTGLAGLAGIPRVRRLSDAASLVRPMLDVTRADALEYLDSIGQPYRTDATNAELHFTRNRIRHMLLPLLEREFNPQVRDALLNLGQIAFQEDYFLDQHAEALLVFDARMRSIPGGMEIDTAPLAAVPANLARHALMLLWTMQRWPLQNMSLVKWEELRQLAAADEPSSARPLQRDFPGRIRAEKHAGTLRLTRP